MPEELLTKRIAAAATNMDPGNEDDVEFDKRMAIMERVMTRLEKDRELGVKERDAETRRLSVVGRQQPAAQPQPPIPEGGIQ
jgi:hypothetical protein